MSYISNKSRRLRSCLIIILFCVFVVGCGGNSSTGSSITNSGVQEGFFVDAAVSGLAYETPTYSGFTDSNGAYNYIEGELVTFSIGDIRFPPVLAESIVTPLTIAGTSDFNNTTVINISRLLQTLDTDGDSSNGITLSEEARSAATELNDIDFNSADFDSSVINLVANSGAVKTILVSAFVAIEHLQESISKSDLIDTDGDGVFNSEDEDDDGDGTPDDGDMSPVGSSTVLDNIAPTVNAGADQTVNEQGDVSLSASASDIDGTIVTYLWTQTSGTSVSLANENSALASFTSPTLIAVETLTFSLTVTDNEAASQTDSISITVNPVNAPPTAEAGANQTVNEQSGVSLSASASDTDGTIVTYLWVQTAGTSVSLSNENSALASFTSPTLITAETLTFSLTVTDNEAASHTDTVDITIVNRAPVATPNAISSAEDVLVNIDVLANVTDTDGDTLTITAASADDGTVAIKSNQTLDYEPNTNFNGADNISFTISDGEVTSSGSVIMTITPVNDAPIISVASASVAENAADGTSLVSVIASDVDVGNLTYSIQTNSENIFGINSASGAIYIEDNTSLNFELATQHMLTVKVEDSGGLIDTAIVTIEVSDVTENVTPTLDASFGTLGTAGSNSFATDTHDEPHDSVLDNSGKLVAVGQNDYSGSSVDAFITRFNTDGTLDRSFGAKGLVTLDIVEGEERATAVNIDSLNRIIIVGTTNSGANTYVFTARYTDTGELDTTFNNGTGYRIDNTIPVQASADAKLDSFNNIIVGASTSTGDFVIFKFAADGSSNEGYTLDFSNSTDIAQAVLIQSDGKALLVGTVLFPGSTPSVGITPSAVKALLVGTVLSSNITPSAGIKTSFSAAQSDFALARFDIASSTPFLDTSYSSDGKASFDFGYSRDDFAFDAYINANDEVVVIGATTLASNATDLGVLKVDESANLVSTFGNNGNGLLTVDIDGDGGGGANESVGKLITADDSGNLYFGVQTGTSNNDSVIHKTDSNGDVINAYGISGKTIFDNNSSENLTSGLLIDSSGKALLLSTTTSINMVEADLVVARFTGEGNIDTSYNSEGFNIFDPTFSNDALNEMIELKVPPHAGKLVAVGTVTRSSGSSGLIITRYNADGSTDEGFGLNGYYLHTGPEATIAGNDIVELSDGTLVAVGSYDADGLIIKLRDNGTLDTSFATAGQLKLRGANYPSVLSINAVAIDHDNKIVVAGADDSDIYMARMDVTGSLDNSFNSSGELTLDLSLIESIEDIAIDADNAIVGVGKHGSNGLLLRVLASGTLDTAGFAASDGYLSLDLDPVASANSDNLKRVKIKASGKIVAAGDSTDAISTIVVAQINSNGTVDTTFDTDGIVTHNYGVGSGKALAMTLDSKEQILLTGFNSNGDDDDIFIARITATGAKDTLFNGANGGILFDYAAAEMATAILALSDDTLMIAGADNLNLFPEQFFFVQQLKLVQP